MTKDKLNVSNVFHLSVTGRFIRTSLLFSIIVNTRHQDKLNIFKYIYIVKGVNCYILRTYPYIQFWLRVWGQCFEYFIVVYENIGYILNKLVLHNVPVFEH